MTGMVTKTVTRGMIPAYRGGFVRTLTIALLLLLLAPLGARAQTDERPRDDPFLEMWARSFYPGRSGDIMLVPREGDILTSETDPFMHGSPWGYDTQVPMILYGPGRIRSGRYAATASHQDLGATLISILGLINRPEATGHVLETTLMPVSSPPRIVAVFVLDAFRYDFLERYADQLSRTPTSPRRRIRAFTGSQETGFMIPGAAGGWTRLTTPLRAT